MELRDPVHNFIYLTREERKLLDLPVMQRLRRIKQLALAYLVYPGATHTRFDHSLGVFHIASQLAKRLIPDNEDTEYQDLVRFAALLHDIGHGPFSHVSEFAFSQFVNRESLNIPERQDIHEHFGWRIIETDDGILKVLGPDRVNRVVSLLRGQEGWDYIKGIVSGPLDADKQDYLLRDSYFCGVKYGIFDLARLIQSLEVHEVLGPDREKHLVVTEDGLHCVEQYILAKYYLTTQVYLHKIRLITDHMLLRAIFLGVKKDNIPFLTDLYLCQELTDNYVRNYLSWADDNLTLELLKDQYSQTCAGKLFRRIHERKLWKLVFDAKAASFRDPIVRSRLSGKIDDDTKAKVEIGVAEALGIDPDSVVLNVFATKSVTWGGRGNEAGLLVRTQDSAQPEYFEDVSPLFRSIDASMVENRVQVYAPVEFGDDPAAKESRRAKCREMAKSVIEETIKGVQG